MYVALRILFEVVVFKAFSAGACHRLSFLALWTTELYSIIRSHIALYLPSLNIEGGCMLLVLISLSTQ
jgi:hypothetical protein